MRSGPAPLQEEYWAALVPELIVANLDRSLSFYRDTCGFTVKYSRPEDRFAYLELGRVQIMLEELAPGRWMTGPLEPPYGRGINFQIEASDVVMLHDRLQALGARMFKGMETRWYRKDQFELGQMQFLVQDSDGYLLRFVQDIGSRPAGDLSLA